MTEDEWLGAEDPLPLLASLAGVAGGAWPSPGDSEGQSAALEGLARLSLSCVCCRTDCSGLGGLCPAYRKLRMFAVACCRRVLPLLPRTVCEPALEMASSTPKARWRSRRGFARPPSSTASGEAASEIRHPGRWGMDRRLLCRSSPLGGSIRRGPRR